MGGAAVKFVASIGLFRHEMEHQLGCALVETIWAGHEEVSLFSINMGANVDVSRGFAHGFLDAPYESRMSPTLHEALRKQNRNLVRLLHIVGVDLNHGDPVLPPTSGCRRMRRPLDQ
jgi:hypothetical protein